MHNTSLGLPNNCAHCGDAIVADTWLARSDDEARSGLGVCVKVECRASLGDTSAQVAQAQVDEISSHTRETVPALAHTKKSATKHSTPKRKKG